MSELNIIEVITDWQQSHEYHACALPSEVVDERNTLSNVVGYIGKIEEDNKRLREALIELVETSMSNERQLAESFLEKFEPSSALVAANKALSQEGE